LSLFKRVISNIELRKQRLENGEFNCIPQPFKKLQPYYQGIEKGKYEMVSALPKRGKTAFTDFFYVYSPILFTMANQSIDINIHYLSLEMTKEQKMMQAMCHFLYIDSKGLINISPKDLRSVDNPLPNDVLATLIKYEPFFVKYLDKVTYYDDIRTVMDITKFTNDLCHKVDKHSNIITELIVDHIGLVNEGNNMKRKEGIDFISNQVFVKARNEFKINPIIVQQQANDKDSIEAKKNGDLLPSFGGLADSKDTSRDIDIGFGVFSPAMAKLQMYEGINVNKYGNNLRIVNIMGGREASGLVELPLLFNGGSTVFNEL
jgi:hypothetical protein